jgi:putative oxygen-independent coproporphyrinogen III oxidase
LAGLEPHPEHRCLDAWSPRDRHLGVYVHVPFCAQRCGYCSFSTGPWDRERTRRYLGALRAEIQRAARAPWAGEAVLDTVFLGGGTPSLLEVEELGTILDGLRAGFAVSPGAEITAECNPESVTAARLAGYRAAGVTRISLGVQSLDDTILTALDRLHTADGARAAFDAVRGAGFDNVSVDLMYGLPGLDLPTWDASVRGVLSWAPEHLSAYALTLDEGSRWHAAGVTGLPPEETVTAQYWRLAGLAAEADYEHYEISNYARPSRRSEHNQLYWRHREYLALGPAACGYLGHVRYGNARSVDRYCAAIERGESPVEFHETLTPRQQLAERIILGLRLRDGVPTEWLAERLTLDPGRLPTLLEDWAGQGLVATGEGRVRLTEAGFLVSDALFVELL